MLKYDICIWRVMKIPCILLVLACLAYARCDNEQPLVRVQQGWLIGERLQTVTRDGYYNSFKGIPYAEPPVGKLRFKAPRPPLPWEGVRSAKKHGSVCTQVGSSIERIAGGEDCLFLNVYTPQLKPCDALPVIVFIHGGVFQHGSGNADNYGPDFLIRKDVIVVTINYRLDSLGFLCLHTKEVPGNAGLKDQVAALRWVRDNIRQFGGDPDNVTVMGQSAGGLSVAFHMVSPLSKGLFKRAIAMSGSPYCDWSLAYQPRRRAFAFGKDLGCDAKNEIELLEFLKTVNASELVGKRYAVVPSEEITGVTIKFTTFTPVTEMIIGPDMFLSDEPRNLVIPEAVKRVDFMFGYTSEESSFLTTLFENELLKVYNRYNELLVPTKILRKSDPDTILKLADKIHDFYFGDKSINPDTMRNFINYANHATFVYDIQRYYREIPRNKVNNMYFYKFSSVSDRNYYGKMGGKYGIMGAAHMDDLLYLFDAPVFNMTLLKNTLEYALVDQATTLFANFAKYGNPTPDSSLGVRWPQFDNKTLEYVNIGQTLSVARAPDQHVLNFWESIFEDAGVPFFVGQ